MACMVNDDEEEKGERKGERRGERREGDEKEKERKASTNEAAACLYLNIIISTLFFLFSFESFLGGCFVDGGYYLLNNRLYMATGINKTTLDMAMLTISRGERLPADNSVGQRRTAWSSAFFTARDTVKASRYRPALLLATSLVPRRGRLSIYRQHHTL